MVKAGGVGDDVAEDARSVVHSRRGESKAEGACEHSPPDIRLGSGGLLCSRGGRRGARFVGQYGSPGLTVRQSGACACNGRREIMSWLDSGGRRKGKDEDEVGSRRRIQSCLLERVRANT